MWQGELHQRERREDVRLVDLAQGVEGVVGQPRLRARAEQAGVVHEEVDLPTGRVDERPAMIGIGDVAWNRGDRAEPGRRLPERVSAAGIHDQAPAPLVERPSKREPESTRSSGDDPDGHAGHDAPSSALEVKSQGVRPLEGG
jgi:hypothetical protein